MERGVHAAVFRVFMSLDTRSLRNAACVCRSWRRYYMTDQNLDKKSFTLINI